MTVSETSLVFDVLDSFEEYWLCISYSASQRSDVFSWLDWVWGRKITEVKYLFRHLKGTYNQHNLSLLTVVTWLMFLHCACTTFVSPLSFLEGHHNAQPVFKDWGLTSSLSTSICIHYLEFFCTGDLSFPPTCMYLFNHLFISVWTHGCFYILNYTLIQPYLFCCSSFPSFGCWKLSVVYCFSLTQKTILGEYFFTPYFLALQDALEGL